jgi:hypothetical protein
LAGEVGPELAGGIGQDGVAGLEDALTLGQPGIHAEAAKSLRGGGEQQCPAGLDIETGPMNIGLI